MESVQAGQGGSGSLLLSVFPLYSKMSDEARVVSFAAGRKFYGPLHALSPLLAQTKKDHIFMLTSLLLTHGSQKLHFPPKSIIAAATDVCTSHKLRKGLKFKSAKL